MPSHVSRLSVSHLGTNVAPSRSRYSPFPISHFKHAKSFGTHLRSFFWCERRDSNPHTARYRILNPARLPVSPRSHSAFGVCAYYTIKRRTLARNEAYPHISSVSTSPSLHSKKNETKSDFCLDPPLCIHKSSYMIMICRNEARDLIFQNPILW